MSFLDKVKAGTNVGVNNNPFGGGVNAFGASPATTTATATTPTAPATAPTFAKPGVPGGAPKPAGVPKMNPSFIAAAPGAVNKPVTPVDGAKKEVVKEEVKAPVEQAPAKEEVKEVVKEVKEEVKEEPKQVSAEEIIKDINETVIEEPKEDKEEKKEETKKKSSRSRNNKSTAKKKTTSTKDVVDSPETVEMVENLFKIPTTTISYSEATKAVRNRFVDEEWDKFREELIAASDEITVESDMTEGALKKTGAALTALRERVWVHFCDTKVLLEELSNKDTEGIIERIKYANLEGANETARKKAGVLAVMNYKDENGNIINLYEVYDETKSRFLFLKGIMDTIKYKSDILITMSAGIKMEKKQF